MARGADGGQGSWTAGISGAYGRVGADQSGTGGGPCGRPVPAWREGTGGCRCADCVEGGPGRCGREGMGCRPGGGAANDDRSAAAALSRGAAVAGTGWIGVGSGRGRRRGGGGRRESAAGGADL